jgi:biotin carboxylase
MNRPIRQAIALAQGVRTEYRVLRCAAACGLRVHVIGDSRAAPLRFSRFCAAFHAVPENGFESEPARAIAQINALAARIEADIVLPTDVMTTLFIASHRAAIAAPCFPTPSPDAIRTLNDKSSFAALCTTLALPHPRTRLVSKAELGALFQRGDIPWPSIVKPIALFGSVGVRRLDAGSSLMDIEAIGYEPILLQDFRPGRDLCVSAFCRGGEVVAELMYLRAHGVFSFVSNPQLSDYVRRIARQFAYDGVLCFDARLDEASGEVTLIECNPRFWFNMDVAMRAGLNFVALGLGDAPSRIDGTEVPNLRGALLRLARLSGLTEKYTATLRYYLADPIAALSFD